MKSITFQVLEGVDKGRSFRELSIPVTIGREEGNLLRLNDERVSRYHAKVQLDDGDMILTDLESTNGTRVNGQVVQIRRLRVGDRITLGRSVLLYGSNEEIVARMATLHNSAKLPGALAELSPSTPQAPPLSAVDNADFDLNLKDKVTIADGELFLGNRPLPPLPQKLSPAQAARMAEILDFLHRHLSRATEVIRANEENSQVALSFTDWQRVLAVQMLLARYLRAVAEPDALEP